MIQKKRNLSKKKSEVAKCKVKKLLDYSFNKKVKFSKWLANVVMVRKSPMKWRMNGDYINLNKTCPKDSCPLQNHNRTVDLTAGHELRSFMGTTR